MAIGLALGLGLMCLADFPSDKFKVDCRVKGAQFVIETDQWATPTWVFETYRGETNAYDTTFNAAGLTMIMHYGRSRKQSPLKSLTGVVSTVTTTFTAGTNFLPEVMSEGYVWIVASTGTRKVVFCEGTIRIANTPALD